MKRYFCILFFLIVGNCLFSQNIVLEGYAYETGNRGFLNQVSVALIDQATGTVIQNTRTNIEGYFEFMIDPGSNYIVKANKEMFEETEIRISSSDYKDSAKAFAKVEMARAPGYQFEITLAPKREDENEVVDAIRGALIEVYNNTTGEEVLVLKDHPAPDFTVDLQKGNHYTILVRKEGFFAKRMEAFVDVKGCILCFEGVGRVQPGVTDNLTSKNQNGVLLANVEMDRLYQGKKIQIENLYYDLGKWHLRGEAQEELKKVVNILIDNPHINIELGSHTDSRGSADSNKDLSEKRAKSAADFLVDRGGILETRVTSRGYGELSLKNHCKDGVDCTSSEHQENRRTELKITGLSKKLTEQISLYDIKRREREEALIQELMNQEQVKVEGDKSIEDVVASDYSITEEEMTKAVGETGIENSSAPKTPSVSEMEESNAVKASTETIKQDIEQVQETMVSESAGTIETVKIVEEVVTDTNNEEVVPATMVQVISTSPTEEIINTTDEVIANAREEMTTTESVTDIQEVVTDEVPAGTSESDKMVLEEVISTPEENPYFYIDGPKIVILESDEFISSDHGIFQRHKQVFQYLNNEKILYLVGDFKSKEEATSFLENTIKMNYPNAYLIIFDKGRIVQN